MTATDALTELRQLGAARVEAAESALAGRRDRVARLTYDMAICRAVFVGLAVTEIASFRGQLSGPQVG